MKESRRILTLIIILVVLGIIITYYAYPEFLYKYGREVDKQPGYREESGEPILNYTPFAIHISILEVSPLIYSINWVTLSPTNTSLVELILPNGSSTIFTGVQIEYRGLYWHTVNISSISIYSTYRYRVGDPSTGISDEFILI